VDEEASDDDDDEESEQSLLKKIEKARKAEGSKKTKDDEIEDGYDEEEDSDYEYTGGDLAIYDSALDEVDELIYVKGVLEGMNAVNPDYVQTVLSGLTQEESVKFTEVM
jgi:hypothetical protein